MTVNPLVAARVEGEKSIWTGIWIAEDIELIKQGVENGSWIDGTLGVVGAGLDALSLITDPVGTLLQYGLSWLIEHVKPLSDALDWLAGDPAQISANAQTWRNVSGALRQSVIDLADAVRNDIDSWSGPAGTAYRNWAKEQRDALEGLSRAAETMGTITECAGFLIAAVRMLVRDAIATVVSRLITYAAELVFSVGTLTPLVVEQATALVASWTAKIARWLKALINSLRKLQPIIGKLDELIAELKKILHRFRRGPNGEPPKIKDPEVEKQRIHDLGNDPATGKHRPTESQTAAALEIERGVTLTRAPAGSSADWVDEAGDTYDAVGNFPGQYFDRQWPQLQYQIVRHLDKADWVPVDVSKFDAAQIAMIEQFIADKNLGPRVFIVGR